MLCDGFPPVEVDGGVRMSVTLGADETADRADESAPNSATSSLKRSFSP